MYVYIIECEDGSLYTGIAKDVVQRLRQHYHHLSGCAKYTLSHQMKDIRAVWKTEDKVTACRLEYWIKRQTRKQKLELIESPERIGSFLPEQEEVPVSIVKVELYEIANLEK